MAFNFSGMTRRGPDVVMEELVNALMKAQSFEFKALFLVIQAALQERKATSGGEEMLRLRAYDKLQTLVREGCVKKTDKKYRGLRKGLLLVEESLKNSRIKQPYPRTFPAKTKSGDAVEKSESASS